MTQELFSDHFANLMGADHLVNLAECCPLNPICLPGLQYDLYFCRIPMQAIVVIMGAPLGTGIQQFEFLRFCHDPRLLLQFPDNRS